MKRITLTVGLLLLSSLVASAAPCGAGTLQNYIDLGAGGCTNGPDVFKSFVTVPGQSFATPILPGNVLVAPGLTPQGSTLTFTLNQTAMGADLFESIFRFTVSGPLTFAFVSLNAPAATGNGVVLAVLNICPGGNFAGNSPSGCPTSDASPIAEFDSMGSQLYDSAKFAPTSFFDVFVDLTADGGGDSSALLRSATVGVAAPEPASAMLLLGGGLALGLLARKRNRVMEKR